MGSSTTVILKGRRAKAFLLPPLGNSNLHGIESRETLDTENFLFCGRVLWGSVSPYLFLYLN